MVNTIDGAIRSKDQNITISQGVPFTMTCLSRCRSEFCQVLWTTGTKSKFVKEKHTVWSSPPYKYTQSHHLTIHSASISTDYQCNLITVTGRIIDSAEQRVHVEEPAGELLVIDLISVSYKLIITQGIFSKHSLTTYNHI